MNISRLCVPDHGSIVPIVVGMDLRAEVADRPAAQRVVEAIEHWQNNFCDESTLVPLVMTDGWYLNSARLHDRPTISLGHPSLNSLSQSLVDRIGAVDGWSQRFGVHLNLQARPLRACLWGIESDETTIAVDRFIDEWIDDFLSVVLDQQQQIHRAAC